MKRHHLITPVILLALITSACGQPTTKTPTPTVAIAELPKDISTGVLISEVLAGVEGNNNMEFIELYNAGDEIVDLKGWTLWYRLATSQEDLLVYRWKARSLIPPHGHYLLGRAGQDLGITPDGTFDQALNTSGGGLALRKPDKETADVLGWGKAPTGFIEGEPAQALENDLSLERSPGGSNGSAADNGDNAGDFVFNLTPDPQNTGSPLTPSVGEVLAISVTAPEVAEPGGQFEYTLNLTNETGQTVHDLVVEFPIPAGLEVVSVPEGIVLEEGITTWKLGALESGASQSVTIPIYVPWTYLTAIASNYYVRAGDWTGTAFGGPVYTQVEGGVIPIGTARSLMNAELIVEGIATMYTGGYFAGGGNTKFYLEDETGGLQVQVFGGEGVVQVATGARVRVKGTIGAYRGSMQIVPLALPGDVETIIPASQGTPWPATQTSIQQAANDFETLPGKLVQ